MFSPDPSARRDREASGPDAATPDQEPRAILVVDDEESVLRLLHHSLGARFQVYSAQNTREADRLLKDHPIHVVVCDHGLSNESGMDYLARLRETRPLIPRILITGNADSETLLAAINRCGVFRFLPKPICLEDLCRAVADALQMHDLEVHHAGLGKENAALRGTLNGLISRSATLRESPGRLLVICSLGLLSLLAAATLIGVLVFLLLYALKAALGIDFLPNWSHSGPLSSAPIMEMKSVLSWKLKS